MPEYDPLFYTLTDISITSDAGLGLGSIKNYMNTPVASFDFEIAAAIAEGSSDDSTDSFVRITELPLITKQVHYHVDSQETCIG